MKIMDSRRSCDDLFLLSQEKRSNDDHYTVQIVNIDLVNVHRSCDAFFFFLQIRDIATIFL
jgi:hypothetical protein